MGCTRPDFTIDAALADPMIAAVMRADRVDPGRLEALLRSKARSLAESRTEAVSPALAKVSLGQRPRGVRCAW